MTTGKKAPDIQSTDWERFKREAAQGDAIAHNPETDPYDPNDANAAVAYWAQSTIKRGRGRPAVAVKRPTLNMRVDADVLKAFKATGPGWQSRIDELLRAAVANGQVSR